MAARLLAMARSPTRACSTVLETFSPHRAIQARGTSASAADESGRGYSVIANAKSVRKPAAGPLGHFDRRLGTDRTGGAERVFAHAQEFPFGGGGRGDDSAQIHRLEVRDIGQPMGQQPAGAGFRRAQGQAAFFEHPHNDVLEFLVLLAEHQQAHAVVE